MRFMHGHGHRHRHRCSGCSRMFCLSEAGCGGRLRVVRLEGDNTFKTKMMDQGVFPGSVITLICGKKNHPCLFSTGDNSIMMDSVSAQQIFVTAE